MALLILLFSTLMTEPASGGINRWSGYGPPGGQIHALAFAQTDQQAIFAGVLAENPAMNGVYRSRDEGATWTLVAQPGAAILCFAVEKPPGRALFAGDANGRVFKTVDQGDHWIELDTSISHDFGGVLSLAISSNASRLYAGSYGAVLVSDDKGSTWTSVDLPSGAGNVAALVADPTSPEVAYAGTWLGVFRTSNGGMTWSAATAGIVLPPSSGSGVSALAVDPLNAMTLYAGLALSSGGVFKSVDAGSSWTSVGSLAMSGPVLAIAVGRADSVRAPVRAVGPRRGKPRTEAKVTAIDNSDVYVGLSDQNGGVLLRSLDGGASWERESVGVPGTNFGNRIFSLAVNPSDARNVYAGTDGVGVFASSDLGATWRAASAGIRGATIGGVALDSQSGAVYTSTSGAGIFKSTDGGRSWVSAPGASYSARCVVVDPTVSSTIYACSDASVLKSTDGGLTWLKKPLGGVRYDAVISIAIDPKDSRIVYAGGGDGLSKSNDGGETWIRSYFSGGLSSINIDPSNTSVLYGLRGSTQLIKSIDGGSTWTPLSVDGTVAHYLSSPTLDPQMQSTLYVGATDFQGGVFKSVDAGQTWIRSDFGMANASISALAVDPATSNRVFAGGSGAMFVSEDAGGSWRPLNFGLPYEQTITCLKPSFDGKVLFAGTHDAGVWRYDFQNSSVSTLPLASSIHGARSTFFHTDVRVLNLSTTATAQVTARYRCTTGQCGNSVRTLSVAPRQLAVLDDIVGSFFGAPETLGAVEFESLEPISVTGRSYTPSRSGATVGTFIPGLAPEEAYPVSALLGLSHSVDPENGFRTDIGVYNPNDLPQPVTVSLFGSAGETLGETLVSLGARSAKQIPDVFSSLGVESDVALGYALIRGDGDHPLYAYAVVLNNQSQDSVFVAASDAQAFHNPTVVLPILQSLPGSGSTLVRSDLILLNTSNSTTARLGCNYECLDAACYPTSPDLSLPGDQSELLPDVVGTTLGRPGTSGSLLLAYGSTLVAGARVYTSSQSQPPLGHFVRGRLPVSSSPVQVLTLLSNNADTSTGVRSSVGAYTRNIYYPGDTVLFTLFDSSGKKIGETSRAVQQNNSTQISDIFTAVGAAGPVSDAYCVVRGSYPLFSFAIVTENQSHDSIYVEGSRDLGAR